MPLASDASIGGLGLPPSRLGACMRGNPQCTGRPRAENRQPSTTTRVCLNQTGAGWWLTVDTACGALARDGLPGLATPPVTPGAIGLRCSTPCVAPGLKQSATRPVQVSLLLCRCHSAVVEELVVQLCDSGAGGAEGGNFTDCPTSKSHSGPDGHSIGHEHPRPTDTSQCVGRKVQRLPHVKKPLRTGRA